MEVMVRGERWALAEFTPFTDCAALHLERTDSGPESRLSILVPFDRPARITRPAAFSVLRPRRWLHAVRRHGGAAFPVGGLRAAAGARLDLLPYQLEPALAMNRHGTPRMLIADAVGLGKTIQAALVIAELAMHRAGFRGLVIAPAGLLHQWAAELSSRFDLETRLADAAWLAGIERDLPPGTNPWTLPGVYAASIDFLKRPEVLHSLESARWDLVVVDEAHAASPGTARRAAADAVAVRSARLILLTATPPAGDPLQFNALCAIGDPAGTGDPIVIFDRSTRLASGGRRTVLLPVQPTARERRMHRLVDAYTARVWHEGAVHNKPHARLAAIVLKKRGLSSAASLAESARRRLALLARSPVPCAAFQPGLPLEPADDGDSDAAPSELIAWPGLADAAQERRWLAAVARAARLAAITESKTRALLRLLNRIGPPVLIFTEFRDTLERLFGVVERDGWGVVALHGGMSSAERAASLRAFEGGGRFLIATDAASEGLNLQRGCRVVVHYELPWSGARLEQRAGRLDRIGQRRTVHELLLVASDTAERLVIAPLVRRARAGRRSSPALARLAAILDESRIARAVMEGAEPDVADPFLHDVFATGLAVAPPAKLAAEAEAEVQRLTEQREWLPSLPGVACHAPRIATVLPVSRCSLPPAAWFIYSISLRAEDDGIVARRLVCLGLEGPAPCERDAGTVRQYLELLVASQGPALRTAALAAAAAEMQAGAVVHQAAIEAGLRRERAIAAALPSPARRLVQAGLFERRLVQAEDVRQSVAAAVQEESRQRLRDLERTRVAVTTCDLNAVLLTRRRGR